MENERIAKSYVWHFGECYFVSTIIRDSSAVMSPPIHRFAETIAWEFDWDSGKRGKGIGEHGHPAHSAGRVHHQIAEHIGAFGEFPNMDEPV